jgi:hypothetical protein
MLCFMTMTGRRYWATPGIETGESANSRSRPEGRENRSTKTGPRGHRCLLLNDDAIETRRRRPPEQNQPSLKHLQCRHIILTPVRFHHNRNILIERHQKTQQALNGELAEIAAQHFRDVGGLRTNRRLPPV